MVIQPSLIADNADAVRTVFACGGGTNNKCAQRALFDFARKWKCHIKIATWAAPNNSDEAYYRSTLDRFHRACPELVDEMDLSALRWVSEIEDIFVGKETAWGTGRKGVQQYLRERCGDRCLLYFSGGCQVQLINYLHRWGIVEWLHNYVSSGKVATGGSSAGCAVLGEEMIYDNSSSREGLGVLSAVVDQHFFARGRQKRFIEVMKRSALPLGIGVEESAMVLIQHLHFPDGSEKVLARGYGDDVAMIAQKNVTSLHTEIVRGSDTPVEIPHLLAA